MLVLLCLLMLVSRMAPLVRRSFTPIVTKMVEQDVALNLWCGLRKIGGLMIVFMAIQNYLSLFLKDLVCAPRPLRSDGKDVKRLADIVGHAREEANHHREYGLPSSHTAMSLAFFLKLSGLLYLSGSLSPSGAAVAAPLSVSWGLWIGFGRMYSAMHSFTDVLAGVVISTVTVPIFLLSAPLLLRWMHSASVLAIAAASLGPMLVYPKPLKDTPSFGDAVSFLGAAAGAVLGIQQQAATEEQPALDIQNWTHVYLTALQLVLGVLLCALTKEAVGMIAKPVMGVVLGGAPVWMRVWWQPPVHGHQPMVEHAPDGDDAGGIRTDGTAERTASSEELVAVSRSSLACNSKGEAMDVLVYSRLCSYAALGLCVTCGAPRVFQLLGIERSQ